MGKAFTKEERQEVQEKLRRIGLRLLAENGIKNISIRQLTGEAGIAQGGFYTFYKDKDDFVEDLFLLRVKEKTDLMYENRESTVTDPRGFIINLIYNEGMHLKENKAFVNSESDTIRFFQENKTEKSGDLYREFLKKMIDYWEENGYKIDCDIEKMNEQYKPSKKGEVSMYMDNTWYKLTFKSEYTSNDAVDGLDVAFLQKYILDGIWGIKDPKTDSRIDFVGGIRGLDELVRRCNEDCEVAFAMYPTSISELFAVANEGRLMPPKSTWFEPKLRSGLFLHDIS